MALALAQSFSPELRHDSGEKEGTPVIDARNIAVTFKVEHGTVEAVKNVSFQLYQRRNHRHCRRVRFGKIGDGAHDHGPAHQARRCVADIVDRL